VKKLMLPLLLVAFLLLPAAFAARALAGGGAAAIKNLSGCATSSIPANDDGSSPSVALSFSLNFFGTSYSSLYVNNNGNVTFDGPLRAFTADPVLSTAHVIIAPYWADVDTRDARSALTTYGSTTYGGRPAFCVNWVNVGYYTSHADKLNSFQLLLIDRSDSGTGNFDIMMNYSQVQWETGDASGGVSGLGGSSARAGYSNGSDVSLELPGSGVNGAFLDSSASGLIHGNRGSVIPGRYVFQVRNGQAPTGGTISGRVLGDPAGAPIAGPPAGATGTPLANAYVQLCPGGAPPCQTTTTDSLGDYRFTGLADGPYNAAAWPPAGWDVVPGLRGPINVSGGADVTGQDIFLGHPGPLPNGVTIDHFATTPSGAPVIHWGQSVPFSDQNCPGGSNAHWELIKDGSVIASGSLSESPSGTYNGKIQPLQPQHGPAVLHILITCPPPAPNKDLSFDVYIDPSGTVMDTNGSAIAGATATLYRSDSSSGPFDAVPEGSGIMAISNRHNPDMTDASGQFHWDVVAGYYKVRAEKSGCHAPGNAAQAYVETAVLTIPPPATGLELTLDCGGGPGPTATATHPAPTPTHQPPAPTPTPSALAGDANCNGTVNSIDVLLILQYVAGLINSLQCLQAADANHNGTVNSIDAAVILQYIAGLVGSL
jgi:hypothetical protein